MPTSSPTWQSFTPSVDSPTPSLTWTLTLTPTLLPPPTNCPPPVGWLPYVVQACDTLAKIAAYYRIGSDILQHANCLGDTGLLPGVVIYVPPVPTHTPVPCGPPYTWVVYYVQPGDTLYRLGLAYGITVAELQQANLYGRFHAPAYRQRLYVPPWATRTPSPTSPCSGYANQHTYLYPWPTLPSDTPHSPPRTHRRRPLPPRL